MQQIEAMTQMDAQTKLNTWPNQLSPIQHVCRSETKPIKASFHLFLSSFVFHECTSFFLMHKKKKIWTVLIVIYLIPWIVCSMWLKMCNRTLVLRIDTNTLRKQCVHKTTLIKSFKATHLKDSLTSHWMWMIRMYWMIDALNEMVAWCAGWIFAASQSHLLHSSRARSLLFSQ